MADAKGVHLEAALIAEIQRLNKQIEALKAERGTVERLLLKTRKENVAGKDVTRKNSAGRVLTEKAILDRIELSGSRGADAASLYRAAVDMVRQLNQVTFRSHLRRMKLRGLIRKDSSERWHVVKQDAPSE